MIIIDIWESQPGKFFFLCTKNASGNWREHVFKRSQIKSIVPFIKNNQDKDIYFCPHGFTKPTRKKEYADPPFLLWADLDEINPYKTKIPPTIAIESSPGRYVGLWKVDEKVNDRINQRLSYFLGADRGGWDYTQVLRVPGTINYKYQSTPKVRLLWSDGEEYKLKNIDGLLPPVKTSGLCIETNSSALYKKWEKKFPTWVRRELINGKPMTGKRSEVFWKLGHTLIEKGLTTDEAFILLKSSPWNKFKGRRDEDAQLRRELDKILNKYFIAHKPLKEEEDDEDHYQFLSRSLSEVEEETIDWIWYPYLARGELTILEGDPGLGKSYLAQMVAGSIIDGKRLPSPKRTDPVKGRVAYFDIENSSGTVTKKRMVANGFQNLNLFFQEEEPFSIDDEETMDEIYNAIEALRPTLVVFDTLNTYIGKADIHKSSETQQAIGRFRQIAKRFNCAVLVLRHLTKSNREKALYRGQGSIAFTGMARVVMTVGVDPEDDENRVVAVTKINVTRPPRALCFTIQALPDTARESDRSLFKWGEFVDLTADQILTPINNDSTKGQEREEAKTFLTEVLSEGEVESIRIERMAEKKAISLRTLRRAADDLQVRKRAEGFGKSKKAYWSLPD